MIAYGYEQPIAITPTEVFNPTTANMVLSSMGQYSAALRELYKDTKNDWKDFMDKYGDFMSSMPGASEAYHDAGVGKAMGIISDWMARTGKDPYRDREG